MNSWIPAAVPPVFSFIRKEGIPVKKTKTSGFSKPGLLLLFLKGSRHLFLITVVSMFALTLLEMIPPQVISFTVDTVLGEEKSSLPDFVLNAVYSIGDRTFWQGHLGIIAIVIVAVALLAALCRYVSRVYTVRASETLVKRTRDLLFSKIQRLPFSWHMKNQTGDIIQRCTSDVEVIKNFISEQLLSLLRIVVLLILSLYFMFSMNVMLAIVATVAVPIVITYSVYFRSKFSAIFQECDENEGVLSTIAQENLTGARVVRAFGRENDEKEKFERQNVKYTDAWIKLCRWLSAFWAAGDLISGLQIMIILVLGTVECVRGDMTLGTLLAFISYNNMLIWPIRGIGRVISEMSKAGVSIDRIAYIMNSEEETDGENALTPPLSGDIVFDHVTFAYDKAKVLDDVSFTIRGGSVFGILGGTGSGKSTLMLLLTRLYELPEGCGTISVGGVDVRAIKLSWLRKNIGTVLQEPFLFSRTLGENIGIAKENITLDEIREAAKIAALDETVMDFPKQYDTIVGERGVTLSGGQKQRAAIARMLTEHATVMVFDDSLSAVDAETDAKIRASLDRAFGDATVILISHRITTLMKAEKILVLDGGRVAELGSHDELIRLGGIYKKIYDIQTNVEGGDDE